MQRRNRHRHIVGAPGPIGICRLVRRAHRCVGDRSGRFGVGVAKGREGAACSCHERAAQEDGGRRLWVFGLATDEGADSGGLSGRGGLGVGPQN